MPTSVGILPAYRRTVAFKNDQSLGLRTLHDAFNSCQRKLTDKFDVIKIDLFEVRQRTHVRGQVEAIVTPHSNICRSTDAD